MTSEKSLSAATIAIYAHLGTGGVVLVAIGSSRLASDGAANSDASVIHKDQSMAKASIVLLFLGWLALSGLSLLTAFTRQRYSSAEPQYLNETRLLAAIIATLQLLGIRVIASLAYIMGGNPDLNGATGLMGYRIGLYFIEELVITLVLVVAGITTRNQARQPSNV